MEGRKADVRNTPCCEKNGGGGGEISPEKSSIGERFLGVQRQLTTECAELGPSVHEKNTMVIDSRTSNSLLLTFTSRHWERGEGLQGDSNPGSTGHLSRNTASAKGMGKQKYREGSNPDMGEGGLPFATLARTGKSKGKKNRVHSLKLRRRGRAQSDTKAIYLRKVTGKSEV